MKNLIDCDVISSVLISLLMRSVLIYITHASCRKLSQTKKIRFFSKIHSIHHVVIRVPSKTSKLHDPSSPPELRHILSGSAVPNEQILLANLKPEPEFVSASFSTNLHSVFHSASSRHIRRHGLAGKSNQETVDLTEEEGGGSSMQGVVIPTLS